MKTALTIAGTDPRRRYPGIKTLTANGVFATCAVTALVAQNTTGAQEHRGVYAGLSGGGAGLCVHRYLRRGEDRHGLQHSLIRVIAAKLKVWANLVDPVMVATSGTGLSRRTRSPP